eukprot:TRINITY_DN10769_c0_g1_i1.p1 TRINITY_DN10769_c0_g1~~TRINITY_DN10769_c0_g1_i1.p1  ORF type:complete len:184 (-),score=7.94 TRINITY_DN10769_c0_g1_i1:75-626(-)
MRTQILRTLLLILSILVACTAIKLKRGSALLGSANRSLPSGCSTGMRWTSWSACSQDCGSGVQSRFGYNFNVVARNISQVCQLQIDKRACNTQACPIGVTPTIKVCDASKSLTTLNSCVAGTYGQTIYVITQSGVNCPAVLQTINYQDSCPAGHREVPMSYMCLGGCSATSALGDSAAEDDIF